MYFLLAPSSARTPMRTRSTICVRWGNLAYSGRPAAMNASKNSAL